MRGRLTLAPFSFMDTLTLPTWTPEKEQELIRLIKIDAAIREEQEIKKRLDDEALLVLL